MNLLTRVQSIERRTGVSNKDPAEMTLAELCAEIVLTLEGDRDRLQVLLRDLPDDALQRQIDALRRATETGTAGHAAPLSRNRRWHQAHSGRC